MALGKAVIWNALCAVGLLVVAWPDWTPQINVTQVEVQSGMKAWACEPSIAADPNSDHIVAGSVLARVHRRDTEGHWNHQTLTSPYGVYGDPILEYGPDGRVYYLHLSNPKGLPHAKGAWLDRIVIQWSDDHGATWSDGVGIGHNPPKDQDKEAIAIDMNTGVLHVAWTEFDVYGSKKAKHHSRIMYSRSADRGETWSDPIALSSKEGNCIDDDLTTEGAVPAVDKDGNVSVVWSYNDSLWVNHSPDGGLTWLDEEMLVAAHPGGWSQEIPGFGRANSMPVTAYSPQGELIVVYGEEDANGFSRIRYAKSQDHGATWRNHELKPPYSVGTVHHFMPWMDVDAQGHTHIVAYCQIDTATFATETWTTEITHTGDYEHFNLRPGKSFIPNSKVFFGDYSGISCARENVTHIIWTEQHDSRNELWHAEIR